MLSAKTTSISRATQYSGGVVDYKMLDTGQSMWQRESSLLCPQSCFSSSRKSICVQLSRCYRLTLDSASWLWHHVSPAIPIIFAYLFFICFSSFVHASVVDPGVRVNLELFSSAPLTLYRFSHGIFIRFHRRLIQILSR